jgi:hypothetical protein
MNQVYCTSIQQLLWISGHFIFYDQVGENEPFVSELLTSLPTTIADLEPHQIHTFYESVCFLESRKYMFCFLFVLLRLWPFDKESSNQNVLLGWPDDSGGA